MFLGSTNTCQRKFKRGWYSTRHSALEPNNMETTTLHSGPHDHTDVGSFLQGAGDPARDPKARTANRFCGNSATPLTSSLPTIRRQTCLVWSRRKNSKLQRVIRISDTTANRFRTPSHQNIVHHHSSPYITSHQERERDRAEQGVPSGKWRVGRRVESWIERDREEKKENIMREKDRESDRERDKERHCTTVSACGTSFANEMVQCAHAYGNPMCSKCVIASSLIPWRARTSPMFFSVTIWKSILPERTCSCHQSCLTSRCWTFPRPRRPRCPSPQKSSRCFCVAKLLTEMRYPDDLTTHVLNAALSCLAIQTNYTSFGLMEK